jgi:hypothetical protein
MNLRIAFISFLFITGLLSSCAPTVEAPVDMGYDFIPNDTDRYYIYNVDSIYIDLFATPDIYDTTHYQIKETHPYTFIDGMGDTVLNITRFYRADSTQPWTPYGMTPDVWWMKRTNTRLERTEENLTFVKMTYPIDVNYTWNGNAYNVLGAQDYFYGPIDVPYDSLTAFFPKTITVVQKFDTTNMIQYYYDDEVYARGVGMISKTEFNIPTLITDTSTLPNWFAYPHLKRIKHGSMVTTKLIEYGYE